MDRAVGDLQAEPGISLKVPYDCQPLMIHGSILSLSVGKYWMRMPLKNQGVFYER
jgi:hypothetical protein